MQLQPKYVNKMFSVISLFSYIIIVTLASA